jgi:hypothetical protein
MRGSRLCYGGCCPTMTGFLRIRASVSRFRQGMSSG